jgi:hypothetical protein
MIVFDDIKSVLQGGEENGQFIFRNIPIDSRIKVMGISFDNGKPLLSKIPAVVTKQPFTLSGFKEFSLKELENQLNN